MYTPGGTSSWGSSIGLEFLHERCSHESLVKLTIGDFARVHQLYITIHVTTEKKKKEKKEEMIKTSYKTKKVYYSVLELYFSISRLIFICSHIFSLSIILVFVSELH